MHQKSQKKIHEYVDVSILDNFYFFPSHAENDWIRPRILNDRKMKNEITIIQ